MHGALVGRSKKSVKIWVRTAALNMATVSSAYSCLVALSLDSRSTQATNFGSHAQLKKACMLIRPVASLSPLPMLRLMALTTTLSH